MIVNNPPAFRQAFEDECEPAFFVFRAADFFQTELVAIEIQRFIDVADTDHCVKIAHLLPLVSFHGN